MTPNWLWTLNSDKYSVGTKDLPLRLKCWSILLYDYWFSTHKVGRKSEMHRMTRNWTWTLNSQTVKRTLYTLLTYPWAPDFGPFRSMFRRFRDTCTRSPKSVMHRMNPNWTWTLNSQKYPVHIKYLPLRPKFWSVSLYGQRFPIYRIFYHVNRLKKE